MENDTIKEERKSYYYAQGEKIKVSWERDLIAVKFHPRMQEREKVECKKKIDRLAKPIDLFPSKNKGKCASIEFYSVDENERDICSKIKNYKEVHKIGEIYRNEWHEPLILTDRFVCKYKNEIETSTMEELARGNSFSLGQALVFSENTYECKVLPGSKLSALELSNKLVEEGYALYAHPEWIEHIYPQSPQVTNEVRDIMFSKQWHLENTGQAGGVVGADVKAKGAWAITKGSPNIRTAIIDDGIDISHPDLSVSGKIVVARDFNVEPPDEDPKGDEHGTCCAGIAIAAQNDIGVSGVAPNCKLIAIRASLDAFASQHVLAKAIYCAVDNNADVISCSLARNDSPWILQDVLRAAIDHATNEGRNKLGCVVFWAVGNSDTKKVSNNGVASYEKTIAVGASTNLDVKAPYSPQGPELCIVAPSGGGTLDIVTTTNMGFGGIDATDYTDDFSGTSAATALAAGVGALVLSANPSLGWQQVRQILFNSADKIGTDSYTDAPANRPTGKRNDKYGYGRVNAEKAVKEAHSLLSRS